MKRIAATFNIILLLISLPASFRLNGQALSSSDLKECLTGNAGLIVWEEIYLHIDRDKYIAGEDIWFSIYNTDRKTGKLSGSSALVYIELLNPWNTQVIQARFQLSDGRGEGNFVLPDSVSSGIYTIRAYTNWMKNFLPGYCYMKDLDVYNPFKGSDFFRKADSAGLSDKRLVNSPGKIENIIDLKTDTIYGRREKVSLKVLISNNKADQSGISEMSISVTPAEATSESLWRNDFPDIGNGRGKYTFESDGHYLSGKIKYRDDNISDSSYFLYMSIQGKVAEFKYADIDTAGRFTFILPLDSKLRNLILQPEHAGNNMILEIDPSFSWVVPASSCIKDTLNDSQLDHFSGLSFNYQATKIYGTRLKKDTEINDETNMPKRRFYGIPEMEIFLDDYIRLPTMQEVFFELVPGIIIRSGKSGYEVKITNPLTGVFYNEPPLVMIDGVIINDLTVLVDLNPEIVEKIEVVKTPYLIGDLILHGIVNVITRAGDFSDITMPDYAVILPYRVIDTPYTFYSPDYSDEQKRLSRKPDLRNTLYWNSSVKTNRNGEAEIEFWTSDLPGIYTINIQGISGTGEKMSLLKSFMVR
jgi:hypothetical protein